MMEREAALIGCLHIELHTYTRVVMSLRQVVGAQPLPCDIVVWMYKRNDPLRIHPPLHLLYFFSPLVPLNPLILPPTSYRPHNLTQFVVQEE